MESIFDRIIVSPPVRKKLEATLRAGTSERRYVERARIILGAASGMSNCSIAREVGCSRVTVRKWRRRFAENPTFSAILDEDRQGRSSVIPPEVRCELLRIACTRPSDWGIALRDIWTLECLQETLLKETGIKVSRMEISRTLRNSEIRPHKIKYWLHSPDPAFKQKVTRICDLYIDPPKDATILCVDEKTGIQALGRKYKTAMPTKGKPGKLEYEYVRNGTTSLIASFEVKTGKAFGLCGSTRTAEDLEAFMDMVADNYKGNVYIIWDNLNTHTGERWAKFNERHGNRFEFVYTPIHASWMNQIEIWFSILQRRVIRHGNFSSVDELINRISAFMNKWNSRECHPFKWTFRGYPKKQKRA